MFIFIIFTSLPFYVRTTLLVGTYLLDPFKISSVTDEASAEVLNRITSLFYDGDGHNQITVILIDDTYLSTEKTRWPLPFAEQSRLVRRILRYKPEALFIDLLYTHDRKGHGDNFASLQNILDNAGRRTPIFIPKPETTELPPEALFKVNRPVVVQWEGEDHYYPRKYYQGSADDGESLSTPATALFDIYCQNNACDERALSSEEPIYLQWGATPHPKQSEFTAVGDNCRDISGALSKLGNLAEIIRREIFWKVTGDWQQSCPHTRTIMAQQLSANSETARLLFTEALAGKTVLLGALIQGARDEVITPVNGKIAGVYLHAMALDNLITMQNNYFRPAPSVFYKFDACDIAEWILLAMVVVWGLFSVGKLRLKKNNALLTKQDIEQRSQWGAVALTLLIFATTLIFMLVFHTQPINWIAVFMVISIVRYVLHRQLKHHKFELDIDN